MELASRAFSPLPDIRIYRVFRPWRHRQPETRAEKSWITYDQLTGTVTSAHHQVFGAAARVTKCARVEYKPVEHMGNPRMREWRHNYIKQTASQVPILQSTWPFETESNDYDPFNNSDISSIHYKSLPRKTVTFKEDDKIDMACSTTDDTLNSDDSEDSKSKVRVTEPRALPRA